jgi:hypothetical protein
MVRLTRQVGVDQLDAAAIHDARPAVVQGDGYEVRHPGIVDAQLQASSLPAGQQLGTA